MVEFFNFYSWQRCVLRFSVRFEKLSQPKMRNRFELVCVKNALKGILCPSVFFRPQKLNLFLILFGTKICIGNIFLQNENCNVIISF